MEFTGLNTRSIARQSECNLQIDLNYIPLGSETLLGLYGDSGNEFFVEINNDKLFSPDGDYIAGISEESFSINLEILEDSYNLFIDNSPIILEASKSNQTFDNILLSGSSAFNVDCYLSGTAPQVFTFPFSELNENNSLISGVIANLNPEIPFKIFDMGIEESYGGGFYIKSFPTNNISTVGIFTLECLLEEKPEFGEIPLFIETNFGNIGIDFELKSSYVVGPNLFDLFPSGIEVSGNLNINRNESQIFYLNTYSPSSQDLQIGLDYISGGVGFDRKFVDIIVASFLESNADNNGINFIGPETGCNLYSNEKTFFYSQDGFSGTLTGVVSGEVCEPNTSFPVIFATGNMSGWVTSSEIVDINFDDIWKLESGIASVANIGEETESEIDFYNLNDFGNVSSDQNGFIYSSEPFSTAGEQEYYVAIKVTHKDNISDLENVARLSYFDDSNSGSVIVGENLY